MNPRQALPRACRMLPAILLMCMVAACQDPSNTLCDPTPQFDIDQYLDLMQTQAQADQLSGYQIVVNRDGNFYDARAGGIARHADDGGEIPMTETTRLNVASVSKVIGAIALLKALELKGLSPADDMVARLPESWQRVAHSAFRRAGSPNLVSFRDLLQMKTGFDFDTEGIANTATPSNEQLKAVLTHPPLPQNPIYRNGNFCFVRVLIGEMIYGLNEEATDYNEQCTERYFEFVDQYIYNYAYNAQTRPPHTLDQYDAFYAGDHPWAYPIPPFVDSSPNGWKAGLSRANSTHNAGTSGKLLSAMDLASILAWTVHAEVLSDEMRAALLADGDNLGFWGSGAGEQGFYHSKAGTKGPDNDERAIKSFVAIFPNGVEAVFLTNCNYGKRKDLVIGNFEKAWGNPCE